jgi:hypothetical protein
VDRTWPLLFAGICLAVFAFYRAVAPENAPQPAARPPDAGEYRPGPAYLGGAAERGLERQRQNSEFMREQGFIQLPACMVPESGPGSDGWWRGGGSP